jgi:hypothetical protein
MKVSEHREEVLKYLTKLNERQITIYKRVEKIENHLSVQNGRIVELEKSEAKVYTIAIVVSFLIPIVLKAFNMI